MSDFTPTPERQKLILSMLTRRGRLSVAEIVRQFSISEATARRDLGYLASRGKAQRVHGGVIAIEQAPPELPILERTSEEADEKGRIGRAAAERIADKETAFIGSGTTALEAARSLRGRDGLTGPRKAGDIGFAALRGGTVVGDHTVIFAGMGERIEFSHRAEDRGIFARGALAVRRALLSEIEKRGPKNAIEQYLVSDPINAKQRDSQRRPKDSIHRKCR